MSLKPMFQVSAYPGLLVFALCGASLAAVAYASVNLFSMSMANLAFLREHGWLAVTSGGLVQLLEIAFTGAIALAFFLVYKVCEGELVARYRRWQDR